MPAGRYHRCCRSSFLPPLNWCTCYMHLTPFDSPFRPWAYKPRGWPGWQKETSAQVAGCLGGERWADADCHRWCQWGQRVWMGCLHGNLWWKTTLIKDHPVEGLFPLMEDHWEKTILLTDYFPCWKTTDKRPSCWKTIPWWTTTDERPSCWKTTFLDGRPLIKTILFRKDHFPWQKTTDETPSGLKTTTSDGKPLMKDHPDERPPT